ncbi:MAG: hypothetical protein JWO41_200 [Candidatus Saccharibacteria bacterium]|nr:hypothetical protein [Candidatus Saccharibacteria bacterium]
MLCLNPDYVNWALTVDDVKGIPNLKAVLIASTAFGWLDVAGIADLGVPVCNVRGFSSQAVAEWSTMSMFVLARQIPRLIKDGFPLDYDKDYMKYRGVELKGKTVGIVGLGNIGTAIAERCTALGMHVTYWSRSARNNNYKYSELSDLMATADVIFPVLAVNDDTTKLLTYQLLDSMKPSAMLIDMVDEVGKGHGLVDLDYAVQKVANGSLYGLGIEAKPNTFNDYNGNVWAAPPYAWTTDSSMLGCESRLVDNILAAAQDQFPNRIN